MSITRQLRPLVRVGLPVAVAAVLVSLALVNVAVVKTWHGEPEDGVLWVAHGFDVKAEEIYKGGAGATAGVQTGDTVVLIDGQEIKTVADVIQALHRAEDGRALTYKIVRQSVEQLIEIRLQPMPVPQRGLYYSLALVGILAIVVGASVRLRRPNDPATLHFYWLTVAFFGVLAFTPAGRYNQLDYFFD